MCTHTCIHVQAQVHQNQCGQSCCRPRQLSQTVQSRWFSKQSGGSKRKITICKRNYQRRISVLLIQSRGSESSVNLIYARHDAGFHESSPRGMCRCQSSWSWHKGKPRCKINQNRLCVHLIFWFRREGFLNSKSIQFIVSLFTTRREVIQLHSRRL